MPTEVIRKGFRFDTEGVPNGFGWVRKQDATRMFNLSERTLQKYADDPEKPEIKAKRLNSEGRVEYLVAIPNETEDVPNGSELKQTPSEQFPNHSETIPNQSEIISEAFRKVSEELSESSRNQRELHARLLAEIDARTDAERKLSEQGTQLANLNSERESFSLTVKNRMAEKKELEDLRKEVEALRKENEQLKKRPFFQFWKKG